MNRITNRRNTLIEREKNRRWPVSCKNCGEVFKGNFCPECGQHIRSLEKPVKEFLLDFLGNLFAFDTRFFNSLTAVIFRPGLMVKEYVGGKSIRYMPPFRLYIMVSFVFFLLLSIVSNRTIEKNKDSINIEIAGMNDTIAMNSTNKTQLADTLLPVESKNPSTISMTIDDERNPNLKQSLSDLRNDPTIFINRFFKYQNWTLFALMPFLGLLLWGAFREKSPLYIVHFVFAIHQHIVFFLIMIIILLISIILPDKNISPEYYLLLLLPLHIYIGAKQLYGAKAHALIFRILIIEAIYMLVVFVMTVIVLLFMML